MERLKTFLNETYLQKIWWLLSAFCRPFPNNLRKRRRLLGGWASTKDGGRGFTLVSIVVLGHWYHRFRSSHFLPMMAFLFIDTADPRYHRVGSFIIITRNDSLAKPLLGHWGYPYTWASNMKIAQCFIWLNFYFGQSLMVAFDWIESLLFTRLSWLGICNWHWHSLIQENNELIIIVIELVLF